MNLWQDLAGARVIKAIEAAPWRVVEAQHILSARDLVDTVEEHELLEAMIEKTKPPIAYDQHYLLFTPFRYPPLEYGSRFGNRQEPSLWYGSLQQPTAFAEVAYYRHKFLADSTADLGYLELLMTAFQTSISSPKGVDLTQEPFASYRQQISDPNDYQISQCLGREMREAGVEAFFYYSARSHDGGINLGAYTPAVFKSSGAGSVKNEQTWLCMANRSAVEFRRVGIGTQTVLSFTASVPA